MAAQIQVVGSGVVEVVVVAVVVVAVGLETYDAQVGWLPDVKYGLQDGE